MALWLLLQTGAAAGDADLAGVARDAEVALAQNAPGRCALLLHGLARTSWSMRPLARLLRDNGWQVVNQGYPSRRARIQQLGAYVATGLNRCQTFGVPPERVDVVTHSMGALLLRYWHAKAEVRLGRVVMLGPPNQGSELVDLLGRTAAFRWYNGPAGMQLGTTGDALWRQLPPVAFQAGVIAGKGQERGLLGRHVAGPNDGKVSVASTRVEGMLDHLVVQVGHTFMMGNAEVQRQVLGFLRTGRFLRTPAADTPW